MDSHLQSLEAEFLHLALSEGEEIIDAEVARLEVDVLILNFLLEEGHQL
jgi:hypothetical protein